MEQEKKIENLENYLSRLFETCEPSIRETLLSNFESLQVELPEEYRGMILNALK